MIDDIERNFVCNPLNGIVIKPFRDGPTKQNTDRELYRLKDFLLKIEKMESFEGINLNQEWKNFLLDSSQSF